MTGTFGPRWKASLALPEHAVWVFSGTSDGNALARELAKGSVPVVVSTASEYGGDIAGQQCAGRDGLGRAAGCGAA